MRSIGTPLHTGHRGMQQTLQLTGTRSGTPGAWPAALQAAPVLPHSPSAGHSAEPRLERPLHGHPAMCLHPHPHHQLAADVYAHSSSAQCAVNGSAAAHSLTHLGLAQPGFWLQQHGRPRPQPSSAGHVGWPRPDPARLASCGWSLLPGRHAACPSWQLPLRLPAFSPAPAALNL